MQQHYILTQMRRLICFLLFVLSGPLAFAQMANVSGTLTDKTGQALPGVAILYRGAGGESDANNGTTTDAACRFSLLVLERNGSLSFSFIGMETMEENRHGLYCIRSAGIRKGAVIKEMKMVDIAPLIALILGIDFKDVDHSLIKKLFSE
jgi:hypothetical protein